MSESKKKAKVFIFAMDHALPTAMAMHEDGNILYQHAGSDYHDAIAWLHYHHPDLESDYEVVTPEEKLVKRHLYKGEPISILGEDFKNAFDNNQKLRKEQETT